MSEISYRHLGKGHPVILIHGFCETHEIWNGFADTLSEKYEVFAIDLPGFGKSPLPETSFSMDEIAMRIIKWIDDLKIIQPVIIGHSLGGYVALSMARLSSEKFKGISLFQSTAFPDSEERKSNRNRVIEFVNTYGTDPFIDTFVPGLFLDKKHPAISTVYSIARKTSKETLLAYTACMRDRSSSADFLNHYERPILVIGGDNDTIVSAEITKEHRKLAPMAEVHLLSNTGHMAMLENPMDALEITEKFIDNIYK